MSKRKDGYYWVKLHKKSALSIASWWEFGGWLFEGRSDRVFIEDKLFYIDPNPITRDNLKEQPNIKNVNLEQEFADSIYDTTKSMFKKRGLNFGYENDSIDNIKEESTLCYRNRIIGLEDNILNIKEKLKGLERYSIQLVEIGYGDVALGIDKVGNGKWHKAQDIDNLL